MKTRCEFDLNLMRYRNDSLRYHQNHYKTQVHTWCHLQALCFSDYTLGLSVCRPMTGAGATFSVQHTSWILRDLVDRGVFSMSHVPGVCMSADLMTKSVSRSIFVDRLKRLSAYARDSHACFDLCFDFCLASVSRMIISHPDIRSGGAPNLPRHHLTPFVYSPLV